MESEDKSKLPELKDRLADLARSGVDAEEIFVNIGEILSQ